MLSKAFKAYAQRKGVAVSYLEFSFDIVTLDGDFTCAHHSIGNYDVINADEITRMIKLKKCRWTGDLL
jgi:hypothetical protein